MNARLRTVIVGLNHYHVTGWVESLAAFQDAIEIVGRYDPDPARESADAPDFSDPNLSQAFPAWLSEVPFWSDLDAMIASVRPELALITLPNVAVPDAVARLGATGTHLLVDKPGGANAVDAAAAMKTARDHGAKVAVAFTRRHGHPWRQVAREIESGRLGRVMTVEAVFTTSSVVVRNPDNHIFDKSLMGGGILSWLGVHDVDLIHWLTGERMDTVQAMTATATSAEIDVEDTISIAFRLKGGALGTMHFAYALPRQGGEGYVAIRGTNASVRIDASGATTWIGAGTAVDPLLTENITSESIRLPGYGTVGSLIVRDLLDAIAEDRDPRATGEDAVAALQVIDAAYASASQSGRRVTIDWGEL